MTLLFRQKGESVTHFNMTGKLFSLLTVQKKQSICNKTKPTSLTYRTQMSLDLGFCYNFNEPEHRTN